MASLATGESIFKYYPESWTPSKSDIRKRVRVKWKNDENEYDTYKGVIQNVSGKKIQILFDDRSNFYGNPNKRSDNPIQNGYIMIKEIKIMDPEKYSGFEKQAIRTELEKDTLGPKAFREKYGIKQRQVHLGKPLNTEVPIGSDYQADIPQFNKKGGKKSIREETVSYFEEFPLYDIGADALSALEILGGGRRRKKKTRKRRKGGRKKTRKKRKRKKTRRKRRTKKAGLTPRSKLEEGIEGCIKLKESNKIRDCRNIGGLKKYHQEQTKKSFFKKIHLPHRPHFHRETKTERHNKEMRDMDWDFGSFGKN